MISNSVYIYKEPRSCDAGCVSELEARFNELHIDSERVVSVPDTSYLEKALENELGILVLPGGNTFLLLEKLQPHIVRIQQAVHRGWGYLGFCSGANIACNTIGIINHAIPQVSTLTSDFKYVQLLPASAWTPAYHVKVKNSQGGNNEKIIQAVSQNETFSCMWNEGARFQLATQDKTTTVEATYQDIGANAAISGSYGKGKVFLSAIHPEVCKHPAVKADAKRQAFLQHLFTGVGI